MFAESGMLNKIIPLLPEHWSTKSSTYNMLKISENIKKCSIPYFTNFCIQNKYYHFTYFVLNNVNLKYYGGFHIYFIHDIYA